MIVAGAVQAQGVITTHKISAALANELVGDAVAQCAKNGYKVEVAAAVLRRGMAHVGGS